MTKPEFLIEIETISGAQPGSVAFDSELTSLPTWDSMAYVMFIAMIYEKLGVTLDAKALARCKTVNDLAALCPGKLV